MLRFTRHGLREMLIGSVLLVGLAILLGYLWVWPAALIFLPFLIFLFAFFRDPQRTLPPESNAMVSPADGLVSDITQLDHDPLLGEPSVRVGIFLSVFNVHVNRAPCDGRVSQVIYKKGRFINAMHHHQASDENESNTIVLSDPVSNQPVAVVKQIVGLIARRIICTTPQGTVVQRGQHIGMIKFGSRTELSIPMRLQPDLRVAVGQKVRGAATLIAILGNPVHPNLATSAPEPAP